MLACAEQHRTDGEMQLVDQAGAQVLPNRRHAAADAHVAPAAAAVAWRSAEWMPSVTKRNSVPPAILSGDRA